MQKEIGRTAMLLAVTGSLISLGETGPDEATPYSPPSAWVGEEIGTARGNPIEEDGAPRWWLAQVYPDDPEDPDNYRSLAWNRVQGRERWFNEAGSQGGQPSVAVSDGKIEFAVRARGGKGWEWVKAAALVFYAPRTGTYEFQARTNLKYWEGTAPLELRMYRHEPKADGWRGVPVCRTNVPPGMDLLIEGLRAPLREGDRLAIVPYLNGYHSGASFVLKDMKLRRLPEATVPPRPESGTPSRPDGPPVPAVSAGTRFPAGTGARDVRLLYGARGDGVTDDTDAIQRAINENLNRGGRVVYFPAGVYLVSRTLSYGTNLFNAKFLTLQGDGRDRTIIRLRDACPGFQDPGHPKPVISMFEGPTTGQAFNNAVYGLTIDVGRGNPGAIALQWMNNNTGGMEDVRLRASDPERAGWCGLDLSRHEPGPALFRNVEIEGFDYGIYSVQTCFSLTFEGLVLKGQRVAGIYNKTQCLFLRRVQSDNAVPAILNEGPYGSIFLYDSVLRQGAAETPAIRTDNPMVVLRNVSREGYARLVECTPPELPDVDAEEVRGDLFLRLPKQCGAFPDATPRTLGLPVEEVPEIPWDAPESWVVADRTRLETEHDDTPAIQSAIDEAAQSGKTTVCIPGALERGDIQFGDTVRIYGPVRRLIGMDGFMGVTADMAKRADKAIFRVENGEGPVVIERMFFQNWTTRRQNSVCRLIEQAAARPVILQHMTHVNRFPYLGGPPGAKLFINDVCISGWAFKGQRVWMRQYNPESNEPMTINDGGDLWVFGSKTESAGGTWFITRNGGRTELLGGYNYPSWRRPDSPPAAPMFEVETGGRLSVSLREQTFHGYMQYAVLVREKRDSTERTLGREASIGQGFFPIVVAGVPREETFPQ